MRTGAVRVWHWGEALHPQCRLMRAWAAVITIMIFVLFIVAPLTAGFAVRGLLVNIMQGVSTTFLLLDIIVSALTGFNQGSTMDHIELGALRAVCHYAKSWLLYDVVTSLPWHFVLANLGGLTSVAESAFGQALYAPQVRIFASARCCPCAAA